MLVGGQEHEEMMSALNYQPGPSSNYPGVAMYKQKPRNINPD